MDGGSDTAARRPAQTNGEGDPQGCSGSQRILWRRGASEPRGFMGMTRTCWLLVDIFSQTLEPDERDAIRGDLAESSETSGRALRDVLGLVVRRQAALWTHWRPWLVLVALIVPLG